MKKHRHNIDIDIAEIAFLDNQPFPLAIVYQCVLMRGFKIMKIKKFNDTYFKLSIGKTDFPATYTLELKPQ